MIDHVGIHARDFAKALRFYREALVPLGYVAQSVDEAAKSAGFGKPGAPLLWLDGNVKAGAQSGVHLAFAAESRAAVQGFHEAGLAHGGTDNGKPGLRADYGAGYYAGFLLDPDGNNVEAVFHEG
ncbi:MAG TPA: VOC family protein [Polyangiaceae bacterium]|jgi:catechol 2,3-dioxygenase-like lactoylglutathione lyase family enzyme